ALDARQIDLGARLERAVGYGVHISLPMTAAVSFIRLEKPHSLSYQETTRQNVPSTTCVPGRSKMELNGLSLKSVETSGLSLTPSTPFSVPLAAAIIALLISSTVVGRADWQARSIMLTFGTGTRIEAPSSLPLSSGSTRPTAFAAPVEVGIKFTALARAR